MKYFFVFYYHNLFFNLKGLKHKISKLAIKKIYERYGILDKSHPLSRYKENSGKNKKNV